MNQCASAAVVAVEQRGRVVMPWFGRRRDVAGIITLLGYCWLGAAACGGEMLDAGNNGPVAGSSGAAGSAGTSSIGIPTMALPSWPEGSGCSSSGTEPWLGVWEGTVEDQLFNPIHAVRIELTGQGIAGLCGNVTWGTPTGVELNPETMPGYNQSIIDQPVDGQTYSITSGAFRDSELRVAFTPAQQWNAWCSAQAPFVSEVSGYGYGWCLPNDSSVVCGAPGPCQVTLPSGETMSVSPAKWDMCVYARVCLCNVESCMANPERNEVMFELSIDGDEARGLYQGWDVVLTRVP